MSAGTAKPTTCARCLGPLAYGHAGATRIFLRSCCDKGRLLLERTAGDGPDDTSSARSAPATPAQEQCRRERQERDDRCDERWDEIARTESRVHVRTRLHFPPVGAEPARGRGRRRGSCVRRVAHVGRSVTDAFTDTARCVRTCGAACGYTRLGTERNETANDRSLDCKRHRMDGRGLAVPRRGRGSAAFVRGGRKSSGSTYPCGSAVLRNPK